MDRYNVVWDTPSSNHAGSMPLGNGDIGLNAWIEDNGDLVFYISKTDSWGDNGRLLKVGRVRVSLTPSPGESAGAFRQTLALNDGMITVQYGEGRMATHLELWVDANHPAINVGIISPHPVTVVASIELWRKEQYRLPDLEISDVMCPSPYSPDHNPDPGVIDVEPDTVLTELSGRIGWYHHNIKSVGPAIHAEIQGIQDFERDDPLLHRTFGAVITARNAERIDDLHLQSQRATSHHFTVYVLTAHPATPRQWLYAVDEVIADTERIPLAQRRESHKQWWREFWNRSWIHVTSADATDKDDAYVVSRAYALQRFVNACAGRGRYPIKFNGSIFTVPYPGKPGDADYRRWGPGYWWQNTRLPYISMCASGDFDMMQPLFRMYAGELMPLFRYRTRRHVGHDGAYIPECMYFWGDIFNETYGWQPFSERDDKLQASRYHKWEWVSGLELIFMMLDYYEHTLETAFLMDTILPAAHEILTFFDQHYPVDESGKLVMHPAQALETWWDCTNPMPEIAGLHAVTDRLLSLDTGRTSVDQRAFWSALKAKLPAVPTRECDGVPMLAPAEKFEDKRNIENPELYAVFPFRLFAVGKRQAQLAINALEHRADRGNFGWRQDDVFMAYLGLADSARDYLVGRARNTHAESRFPAFWGPNYDWIPDQDHGGILLKTLQAMLMQTDGRGIYLFPAWPEDWDVDFKLHAPYNTVIEGSLKGGKLVALAVSPESRRQDVTVMACQ